MYIDKVRKIGKIEKTSSTQKFDVRKDTKKPQNNYPDNDKEKRAALFKKMLDEEEEKLKNKDKDKEDR